MRHRLPAPHGRSKYNFKIKFRVKTDNNFPEKKVGRVDGAGGAGTEKNENVDEEFGCLLGE